MPWTLVAEMGTLVSLGVCGVQYIHVHELDGSYGDEGCVNNSKKTRSRNKTQWPVRNGIF